MKITKRNKVWYESDNGFEFHFEPIADSVKVKKTKGGYEVRYLVQDDYAISPDEDYGDNSLFLTSYHRDFWVDNTLVSKRDCQLLAEDDINELAGDEKDRRNELRKQFWTFGLEAYIHSGVRLAFRNKGDFPDRRWDVSFVGLIFADKKEFKTEQGAEKAAAGLIKTWNMYLSGDVYMLVKEEYNKDKQQKDYDCCGNCYGYNDAISALKTF